MKQKPLARFEALAQRLVEGSLARLLGGRLEMAEITAQLARAIEDNLQANRVPDRYLLTFHPDDEAILRREQPTLADDLAALIVRLAREAGLSLPTWPQVTLQADGGVGRQQVRIQATHNAGAAEATQVYQVDGDGRDLVSAIQALDAFLILDGRHYIPLLQPIINLGRRTDNDVVLDAPTVSRRHAQLRWRFGRYIIYDVGSRGGTFVNDEPVTECVLHPGDVIRLSDRAIIYGEGLSRARLTPLPPDSPDHTQQMPPAQRPA